ncbi:polysaccharide biosynthesis/export family protein [Cecembia lonarensis]|uniref:Polysaccharide biosynthesis/export protein n=1 Tax=Cecembia lonarensis (strain CCUG 58316 / KCTC 22772 / LW9) TaxID=1225176 RepID=K1KY18_CECL9|nr:polysaccharide biosynthesis/export family protein [Cecembia lonarensis]EKB47391.1 Polysaccharide biosynthesis/export protein [Cecembia lonarensis LW9]
MRSLVLFSFVLLFASACISNKRIVYLQNLPGDEPIELDEFIPFAEYDKNYILQPFDVVDIDFASADEELTKAFEFQGSRNMRMGGMGMMGAGDMFFMTGYVIDVDGYVNLPRLGKIKISGLTEEQARIKVEEAIREYFKDDVYVRLRIGGIRFTALGEFNNSGTKVMLKHRATIFDAIALAGESNILAKKNKLFLIRQYDGGSKIHQINLNDRALLASPYYFIQNNDILYLEPMNIRQFGRADNLAASLGLIISVTSSIILIFALVGRNL